MQEEQQLGFVVLPKLKSDGAMYDSTYPTAKTREEQQQMWAKLLFYHSKLACSKMIFFRTEVQVPLLNRFEVYLHFAVTRTIITFLHFPALFSTQPTDATNANPKKQPKNKPSSAPFLTVVLPEQEKRRKIVFTCPSNHAKSTPQRHNIDPNH